MPILRILILSLLVATTAWAQSKAPSFAITGKSKTDQPAAPGRQDEAATVANYLENQIAIAIQEQNPCASTITDQDMRNLMELERMRELLGSGDEKALASLAQSWGVRYAIQVNVTQMGGKDYMTATAIDMNTGKPVDKMDSVSPQGKEAVGKADSLAQNFADSLNGMLGSSKAPRDGDKVTKGTPIQLKCSCEGNGCNLWPLPDNGFPDGFVFAKNTVTSSLVAGEMVDGTWQEGSIIVGTAVTEEWEGGRCVKVATGGVQTTEPAPTVFKILDPGTYILRVRTEDYANRADCNGSPPCSAGTQLRSSNTTVETKFTVTGCSAR